MPVLILSMYQPDQFARRAMNAAPPAISPKTATPPSWSRPSARSSRDRRYLNPEVIEEIVSDMQTDRPDRGARPHESLSDREYQVMRMIASGLTVSQIGLRLSLSVKTISTFRARVLKKMEMKTTAELMHYAIQHGLVD